MAEIAGIVASSVILAGLFASCLQIFSIIEKHRNADEDQATLSARLKIEQCLPLQMGHEHGVDRASR